MSNYIGHDLIIEERLSNKIKMTPFQKWRLFDYGPLRRKAIIKHIELYGKFAINCRSWPKSKIDKDIKYLLKRRIVKQIRVHCGYDNSHYKTSYLVLNKRNKHVA